MGKKKRVIDYQTVMLFRKLKDEGKTIREICDITKSSSVTVVKYLKEDITTDSIRIGAIEERLNQLDQKINLLMEAIKINPPARKPISSPIPKDIPISNDIKLDDDWISLDEAMKLSELSRPFLSKLCQDKRIESVKKRVKSRKCWIINKKSLEQYLRQ